MELLGTVLIFFFLTVGFPAFLLYGLGGAEKQVNLVQFFFYGVLALPAVIVIFAKIYLQNRGFFEERPAFQGFQYVTLHSPEHTWLGKRFKIVRSWKALTAISLVLAMGFGAMVSISGQFVSGVPTLVQGKIHSSATLGLAVEPAVSSETLFFNIGMLGLQSAGLFYFFRRREFTAFQSAFVARVIAVFLTTAEFYLYHNFRYGTAETSQIGVLMLGFLTNTLTALTNSMIPAYMIHGSGNLFHKATVAGIFTNEIAVVVTVIGMVVGSVALWVSVLGDNSGVMR